MVRLAGIFGAAMGSLYDNGTLRKADGAEHAVKLQRELIDEQSRNAPGFVVADASFIILQHNVKVRPTADDELVTDDGRVWAINSPPQEDPGRSYWKCMCTEIRRA